jgi:uncharacterized protein (TIGR02246 family)
MTGIAATLLLALGGAAAAHEGAPVSVQDCWLPAFKAGDADAVAACYAEDAVMWFPGGPMAQGRQAIRDGYAGFFAANTIKDVVLTPMGHQESNGQAASWGTFVIVWAARDTGVETRETGRYTDVSKLVDGHWLYVADHPSDDPPPAPAAPAPDAAAAQ